MAKHLNAHSAAYQQWSRAQERVSDYEKLIFDPAHPLQEAELSHLRELRATAAACLRELIEEMDDGAAREREGPSGEGRPGPST